MDDHGEDEIDDEGPFAEALAASQAAQTAYKATLPDLTQARRQFFKLRTPEGEAEMERQEARVVALFDALTACIESRARAA